MSKIDSALEKVEGRESLVKLVKYLADKPRTPRDIAEKFQVSKPTAYAQINKLTEAGIKLDATEVRQGVRGPASTAYMLK